MNGAPSTPPVDPPDLQARASGIVLHITALPGPHGMGDLGDEAWRFVDWLASAGQRLWQVLPLNPVGPGHSPYQSPSAFAGNVSLVALQPLVASGWLPAAALADVPAFDAARVDWGAVTPWRWERLRAAAAGFFSAATSQDRARFEAWCETHATWLEDWTLFAALKDAHDGQPWWAWSAALARREPAALSAARAGLARQRREHAFAQWCFDEQVVALRAHARRRGVRLMGDVPIFVAHDSADVWARPDLYFLDHRHQPSVVAGCPPDGYSPDGQRWGNPLYRWERMAAEAYGWWVARVGRALNHADLLRIDHFRGFAACWEVPARSPTAREGRWVPGPGEALFAAIEAALGRLPIVAEDLGTITPDVVALREHFGYPGMRIVQEAFSGDARHPFLPHQHVPGCLAYSSTHDSDTALGWWRSAAPAHRAFASAYLQAGGMNGVFDGSGPGDDIPMALVRAASHSVAALALFPMQDVLALDGSHRFNLPGTASGNWGWRFSWPMVGPQVAPALARLAVVTGRAA